jgi:2,4-dienoyl-CoA reductase-like NADH-dependent reductase (Old Yellow Enzyme family)
VVATEEHSVTRENLHTDPLLRPFVLKHLVLKNRIMSTSHACGLEEGGIPKERYQLYHEEKAKGGLALTMFGGSSNVAPDSPNAFHQLNVGIDEIIPYFAQFSDRIHRHGCALMCQITHVGRRGDPYVGPRLSTIGPSPIRETLHRSFPREMDQHDIARVVKAFGDAACRCKEGGLDGIETLTSGHMIGQFLSAQMNRRTDRFGGSIANRCRFAILVHQEIRRRVGDDFIVGIRWVTDEGPDGGLPYEESVAAAKLLEAEAGLDFFNALFGKVDNHRGLARDNMPGMDSPIAPWVERVGKFKREVGAPVFHAARILDTASARFALRAGHLDMVGMTRPHIADPHLVAKLIAGKEAQIRPCVGATHCMTERRPACLHNPASGYEQDLPHVIDRQQTGRRRIVVVGGGPAGLEAARVCAERGHEVVLFEAGDELGGQVLLASRGSWRRDLIGIIAWRAAEIERLGVTVQFNCYAEAGDILDAAPDVVILATGGVPDLDWIDGKELCTSAWDTLAGVPQSGGIVTVIDATGRHPALLVAERLAKAGSKVQFVSIDERIGAELTYSERVNWKRRLHGLDVELHVEFHLLKVRRAGASLECTLQSEIDGEITVCLRSDGVIVESGTQPVEELFRALQKHSCNDGVTDLDALLAGARQPWTRMPTKRFELHRIGDAVSSRNISSAVLDALRLSATC